MPHCLSHIPTEHYTDHLRLLSLVVGEVQRHIDSGNYNKVREIMEDSFFNDLLEPQADRALIASRLEFLRSLCGGALELRDRESAAMAGVEVTELTGAEADRVVAMLPPVVPAETEPDMGYQRTF